MHRSLQRRALYLTVLFAVFAALLVWAGTIEPDPDRHNYPDTTDIHDSSKAYVGDRVSVGGVVADTEPLTIDDTVRPGETVSLIIEDNTLDADTGDTVWVYGTLRPNGRVEAINTVQRPPGDRTYMYLVSFAAGLLVLGRLVTGWTIDTTDWTVVPRSDTTEEADA
jgi:hypothetical protein